MPPGDVIIIGPGPKVKTSLSNEETVSRLREAADLLESGSIQTEPSDEAE